MQSRVPADVVRLIATYLHIDELIAASASSRSLQAVFDSDAVWQARLEAAQAIQHVDTDYPLPDSATLSAEQMAALPPLPSLSVAADIFMRWWLYEKPNSSPVEPAVIRPTSIVHLPSTLQYHIRLVVSRVSTEHALEHVMLYVRFALRYERQSTVRQWVVADEGDERSGWWAVNSDDLLEWGDHSVEVRAQRSEASGITHKRRYIQLLQCSEHQHNHCHRLLPPSPPRPVLDGPSTARGDLPSLSPLPLCASCRTAIAGCIDRAGLNLQCASYAVWGVTRINRSIYETSITRAGHPYAFRVSLAYKQQRPVQRTGKKRNQHKGETANGETGAYQMLAHYVGSSAMYRPQYNVCKHCHCAFTKSGQGHRKGCAKSKTDAAA